MIKKISRSGHVEATKENGYQVQGQLPADQLEALFLWVEAQSSPEEVADKLITENATDEEALLFLDKYDEWRGGENYQEGDRRRYRAEGGEWALYKIRKDHKSQDHQPPSIHTLSLYIMITPPEEEGKILPWEDRWSLGKELYKKEELCSHVGFVWESGQDNNHWEPGAPGVDERIWKKIRPIEE